MMGEFTKIQATKIATCTDCGRENRDQRCEAWAKRHAKETGHIPTVHVSHDIHFNGPTNGDHHDEG